LRHIFPRQYERQPLIFINALSLVRKYFFVPDDAVLNLGLGWPLRSHERSASSPKFRSGDAAGGFALAVKLPCHGGCQHGAVPGLTEKQLSGNMAK
jgi:hypothetical protein